MSNTIITIKRPTGIIEQVESKIARGAMTKALLAQMTAATAAAGRGQIISADVMAVEITAKSGMSRRQMTAIAFGNDQERKMAEGDTGR